VACAWRVRGACTQLVRLLHGALGQAQRQRGDGRAHIGGHEQCRRRGGSRRGGGRQGVVGAVGGGWRVQPEAAHVQLLHAARRAMRRVRGVREARLG